MRILVCSDSHGRRSQLVLALEQQPRAEILVFLGDGAADADFFAQEPGKQGCIVRGNCDFGASLPLCQEFTVMGKRVLCTHGHAFSVKHGLDSLQYQAERQGADLVLFGHTHAPLNWYDPESKITYFNPGSIREGDYGFVDITEAGIVCCPARVRPKF